MSDSDKFPTDFVPVSRPLVEELGYQAAYIFGIVWNYCQMESGICNASHDTIAGRAGMSRRSAITHLDELIKAGYIEDLTPDVRNAPHHLSTKIGVQKLHSKERITKEERPAQEPERCENPAHQNGVGMQNLHSGYAKNAHRGMQNLHKNRQNKETELIEDSPIGDVETSPTLKKVKEPTVKQLESQAMFKALADLCQYDLDLIADKERGKLNQAEKKMRDKGYTPDNLKAFGDWWYSQDWRGKQQQPPTLTQIRETWGQFRNYQNGTNGRDSPPKLKLVITPASQEER
jgi:hypothetical protein